MSDIRKWFMKQHDMAKDNSSKPAIPAEKLSQVANKPDNRHIQSQGSSSRRITSKYFNRDKQDPKVEKDTVSVTKTKAISNIKELPNDVKSSPVKRPRKMVVDDDDDVDEDFVKPFSRRNKLASMPNKKLNSSSGRGVINKEAIDDLSDEDPGDKISKKIKLTSTPNKKLKSCSGIEISKNIDTDVIHGEDSDDKTTGLPVNSAGRGRGRRGGPAAARGSGAGRGGGFMNFGERKDPPHKGEKEIPEGGPNCLAGLTFVISGTLDSLEREEAEDLIKRHGGRVTGSVSKKTSYLLCDEDIEGRKSAKAKELGTSFLTEDALFDMIRRSFTIVNAQKDDSKITKDTNFPNKASIKTRTIQARDDQLCSSVGKSVATKGLPIISSSSSKQNDKSNAHPDLTWTEKYKPRVPNDIIGNQSLVNQLRDWLTRWNEHFRHSGMKGKGKKQNDSIAKKAVLLNGTPGIGKTTSAKLVSQMLGFQTIEVNASDSRGKADMKIQKGVDGKASNSFKELVSNESLGVDVDRSRHLKTVLIMDEVDGMSAGDRGGVADLIASIKISKIPIVCICNERYNQKLKSLVDYCLLLSFRKPTKQQMAKRLLQIANSEGLQVNEIALEELAARCNGDMRMAVNQLQYLSLSFSVINYDDIRQRLIRSAKDEDISPFTAVEKLFNFDGGSLEMDKRIDLSMSDSDLVPLLIQENYLNYRPSWARNDENGLKRMSMIARAAESIAEGDIINKQVRRYQMWQLSQMGSLVSCIIPAAFLHGQREVFQQGERNFNRFSGWLGKNSTMGKNFRLLEDLHVHFLASRQSNLWREALRVDYFTLVLKQLTDPLRMLTKDEAVDNVLEFMSVYSITQEDFDTIVELSKYQAHRNPLDGILPAVKSALTRAYNQRSSSRVVRVADLITIPGMKKTRKKAKITTGDDLGIENDGEIEIAEGEKEEENTSDTEDPEVDSGGVSALQSDLQNLNSSGIKVELELKGGKGAGNSSGKKTPRSRAPVKRKR